MASYITKRLPSAQTLKARTTTLKAWELPKEPSALAPDWVRTNRDMDPTPLKDQTWSLWTWMAYWATDMINLGTWETASSIIAVGLTWREAIPIMAVGTMCVAVPVVLNGAIGAHLHVPFSIIVRSGFGYYFAYFCIASRSILAMFWLGIQSYNGSLAMTIMLRAIWPSYNNIPDTIGEATQGISTQGMISYLLFSLIQLPLLLIPPTRLRWLFIIKLIVAPITAIATMACCVSKAGSSGDLFNQTPKVSGSDYAYLWLSCMSSVTGTWATLGCNIPDFTRYAKSSRGQYIQLPFLPIIFTLCGVIGVVTTSASIVIYNEGPLWNPLDICAHWLDEGHGGRAAAFFAALSWYIAQVGTNITANSISAANDLTVLFPRYVNIKRGCVIAAIVGGWVIVPWKILSSAQTFLAFMGGYAVFLAPMAGVIAADYWLIKRRHLDIPALYNPHGRYRYWFGVNPHGLIAFVLAVAPNLPGLAHAINPKGTHVSAGVLNLYSFDWLYGFVVSIFIYTTLGMIWPLKASLVSETVWGLDVIEGRGSGSEGDEIGDEEKRGGNVESKMGEEEKGSKGTSIA
nr:hypothetical protein B0A51_13731 [Rachicladosporium sp. CCFEE 5018]